jgi:hypothetical protein
MLNNSADTPEGRGERRAQLFSAPSQSSLKLPGPPEEQSFVPLAPETLEETGLSGALIEQLILKMVYFRGEVIGRDISSELGLKFAIIDPILQPLKRRHFIEIKGSLGFGDISAVFALGEAGRDRVRECLEDNQYSGAAPVPIAQYCNGVRQQRFKKNWLTKEALVKACRHMVLSPGVLTQLGPAVSSGRSLLIYGQAGNGKTYLAEALAGVGGPAIYVPHAIDCQGTIIKVFDPVYHERIEEAVDTDAFLFTEKPYDGRWVHCRRPFIATGGELTMNMLDLNFNPVSKIYDAPYQLKANNGIYLIDDFGRQKVSPAEVLNRWIVPMDRRVDYLTFHTGGKMEVPFETFLVFSTNMSPDKLGDEAFLRRIEYKIFMKNPTREEFCEIFRRYCASKSLRYPDSLLFWFVEEHYKGTGKAFRRCHPRDVISHAIDLMSFEGLPLELTQEVLERGFEGCFVEASVKEE